MLRIRKRAADPSCHKIWGKPIGHPIAAIFMTSLENPGRGMRDSQVSKIEETPQGDTGRRRKRNAPVSERGVKNEEKDQEEIAAHTRAMVFRDFLTIPQERRIPLPLMST